jgi:hypothetical protein
MFSSLLGLITNIVYSDITQSQTDEIVATTLDRYSKELINHTIMEMPLYSEFLETGNRISVSGGHRFRYPIVNKTMDKFSWFGPNDTFSPQDEKLFAWTYADLKQGISHFAIDDVYLWQNEGEGKIADILQQRMNSLEQNVRESLGVTIWSDGTEHAGKDPSGLKAHIPNTPTTGSYMGFSRVINYWARPWYYDSASPVGPHSLTAPTNNSPTSMGAIGDISDGYPLVLDYLDLMWKGLGEGQSPSDLISVTDAQTALWYSQIPRHCKGVEIPVYDRQKLMLGTPIPMFNGSPVFGDLEQNGAPTGEWRVINKKYYRMIVDTSHFFQWVGPRSPYNALKRAWYLVVRFQWVDLFPRRHGIMTGISTWQA